MGGTIQAAGGGHWQDVSITKPGRWGMPWVGWWVGHGRRLKTLGNGCEGVQRDMRQRIATVLAADKVGGMRRKIVLISVSEGSK